MDYFTIFMEMVGIYFTTVVRWVFVVLAVFILLRQIRSLLQVKNPSEIWAYLGCPDDTSVPLTHWENLIGRGRGCDVILNLSSVSRSHATLIRDSAGVWKYNDLNSKNGSKINGRAVKEPTVLKAGDVLTIGGSDFTLYPVSLEERRENIEKRKKKTKPVSPWPSLVALTIFQLLTIIQFRVALGDEFPPSLPVAYALLCALMWFYVIFMRALRRVGFEMEIIAFFLSTLSLAVTASEYPGTVLKQAICIVLGLALFFGLCWFLRDLNRAKKIINILMAISAVLLILNLILGETRNGSQNWISIGGFSFQPSELVKIVFVYVGAASLDELQQRRNLTIFMIFSVFCLGCLAIMGDFGTAIIFFATFLIISFLRSGDFSKLILIIGAAGLMGLMVLRFKPYIATRFETWGHAWEYPTGGGYQQVQGMSAAASGGLPGLGAGNGNFSDVSASSTDLVFELLSEEWGLIIAILAVFCIITLGIFAVRSIVAGRSTYYSIAACAATSMFMFQTILNVFGSIDLLPLTGVTFPLVSSGGTSMIASWGLLAFLKAADTRQNASFAIRLDKKGEFEYEHELEGRGYENPEELFRDVPAAASARRNANTFAVGGIQRKRNDDRQNYGDYQQEQRSHPSESDWQAYMAQREHSDHNGGYSDRQAYAENYRSDENRFAESYNEERRSTDDSGKRGLSGIRPGRRSDKRKFEETSVLSTSSTPGAPSASRTSSSSANARMGNRADNRMSSRTDIRTDSRSSRRGSAEQYAAEQRQTGQEQPQKKRKITYKDFSDEDFFNSFESAAPSRQKSAAQSPQTRQKTATQASPQRPAAQSSRRASVSQPSPHSSQKDEQFFNTLKNGPSGTTQSRSSKTQQSKPSISPRSGAANAAKSSSSPRNEVRRRSSIDDDPLLRGLKSESADEDDRPLTLDDIFGDDNR